MAAVYLHERNFLFESRRSVVRYHQSAALVFSKGGRRWDGTAGAGGRALCFFVLHPPDNGALKVENVLFDRLWQHQDLDVGVIPMRSVTNLGT